MNKKQFWAEKALTFLTVPANKMPYICKSIKKIFLSRMKWIKTNMGKKIAKIWLEEKTGFGKSITTKIF